MSEILVLDYGVARPGRLVQAFKHLGVRVRVTANPHDVRSARRLVLPDGDDADRSLERGLRRETLHAIRAHIEDGKPTCAIGLSSMLLLSGNTHGEMPAGLGLFAAPIQRFDPRMTDELERPLKAPHTGFAFVVGLDRHPQLGKVVPEGAKGVWLYFSHRLCAPARVPFADVAVAHHGVPFAAAIWRESVLALQFLPERSGALGLDLLKAWAEETE